MFRDFSRAAPVRRVYLEAAGIFIAGLAILLALGATAPFSKELGVCESGAVRDVLAGNLILPRFIPGPIVHVPPLYWWVAAVCVRLFGWSELAFRLPALVPAALTCSIIYAWTAARLGRTAAIWAASALLLCHFFIDAARQPRMDSMLAMFVTAAAVTLEAGLTRRRRSSMVAAAIAIGLGCLTKGILGIALPGIVIALYLLIRGRLAELFRFDLIAALAGGLVIGLLWYSAGYATGGSKFLEWQVGMNLWSRFIPAEAGGANYCVHPIWYFAPQILSGFLPWSLYIPAFAAAILSMRDRAKPEPVIYALCWFAAIFAFFSLSRGKCQVYILPAFPPLAVLIGWSIGWACAETAKPAWFLRLFTAASVMIGSGAALLAAAVLAIIFRGVPNRIAIELHPTDRRYLEVLETLVASGDYRLITWIALSTVGALVLFRGVWRRSPPTQVFGVFVLALAGVRFWFGVMNPALAARATLARFAREINDVVPTGAAIGHIGIEDCDLYFYSPRPIQPVFHFRCNTGFPPYLVIRKQRFDAMAPEARTCLTPILVSDAVDSNGPRLLLEQVDERR